MCHVLCVKLETIVSENCILLNHSLTNHRHAIMSSLSSFMYVTDVMWNGVYARQSSQIILSSLCWKKSYCYQWHHYRSIL